MEDPGEKQAKERKKPYPSLRKLARKEDRWSEQRRKKR